MKTGELFALSCDLGAYLSGAAPGQRAALRHYGLALGTAYQVYDDCLDLFGSEELVGKSLGTDLAKGKMTLPMIWLLQQASVSERARIVALLQEWEPAFFPQVLGLLKAHGALDESRRAVQQYLQAARKSLRTLAESASRAGLLGVIDYLAQQTDGLRC
jgi:octaprenyl-diphosphate synthase